MMKIFFTCFFISLLSLMQTLAWSVNDVAVDKYNNRVVEIDLKNRSKGIWYSIPHGLYEKATSKFSSEKFSEFQPNDVLFDKGKFVCVGEYNNIWYSYDGK